MKIAFLFSGQYRDIPSQLSKLSLNNLTKDIDYEIFCYSWDEPGESLDHRKDVPIINHNNDSYQKISELFKEYNLKSIKTEPYNIFLNNLPKNYKIILQSPKYHKGTINALPQIYTLSKCYKLIEPQIEKYDLIFRCRFDSIYIHPLSK